MGSKSSDEDLRQDVVHVLRTMVRAGFMPRDQIWLAADDVCEEAADPDAMRAFAAAELERLWAAQRAAEASWEGRTDCDRLDQAFAELESTGIVCRQDFTCCGNCGAAEIGDEFEAVEAAGVKVRGYAFYHQQDTERAIDGDGVYLNYGAEAEGEAPALEIAREIVSVLTAYGLRPDWNGSWGQRIHVPMQWRRRLSCS